MITRWMLMLSLIVILPILTIAQARIQGFAERGGKVISTSPTTKYRVQESYPGATLTIYETGTTTLAPIFTDSTLSTPKANPFTADSGAYYYFYTDDDVKVDIRFSGTGVISPFTIPEVNGIPAASSGGGGSSSSTGFNCDPTKGCFDPNVAPYNCVADNSSLDSTACTQAVLNAAAAWTVANSGKPAGVYFDDGLYYLKSDLNTTGGARAQVYFPSSTYNLPGTVLVTSKSERMWTIGHFNSNSNASLLFQSTLTGKAYTAAGWPAVFGGRALPGPAIADQNWIQYHFKKVCIRQNANPSLASLDGRALNRFIVEDSRIDVIPEIYTLPVDYALATNPTGVGVMMPLNNADSGQYRGWIEISGYYGCMGISETTTLTGHAQTVNCKVGEFIQAPFYHIPSISGSIYDVRNEYGIAYIDPSTGIAPFPAGVAHTYLNTIKLAFVSFENSDNIIYGPARTAHIYDPTSNLRVFGEWGQVKSNSGNHGLPLMKTGARNILSTDFRNIYAPDYREQAVVLDNFDATDGTLITANKPNRNLPGGNWTALTNNFIVTNNHARGNTGGADNDVIKETGLSDGTLIAEVRYDSAVVANGIGVNFRATDVNNRYFVEWSSNPATIALYKRNGGVTTNIFLYGLDPTFFPVGPDSHTIRVNLSGNNIQILFDYAVIHSFTDSFNSTATKHGIHSFSNQGVVEEFKFIR